MPVRLSCLLLVGEALFLGHCIDSAAEVTTLTSPPEDVGAAVGEGEKREAEIRLEGSRGAGWEAEWEAEAEAEWEVEVEAEWEDTSLVEEPIFGPMLELELVWWDWESRVME